MEDYVEKNMYTYDWVTLLYSRGLDKEDVVHLYHGIVLSHKKEQNNVICSNMDATRDSHVK